MPEWRRIEPQSLTFRASAITAIPPNITTFTTSPAKKKTCRHAFEHFSLITNAGGGGRVGVKRAMPQHEIKPNPLAFWANVITARRTRQIYITRIHSSRMRTVCSSGRLGVGGGGVGCLLPGRVRCLLWGMGVSALGVCCWGDVCSWEGGCLLWGECLLPGGVGLDLIPLLPGRVRCLLWGMGVSALGVCCWGDVCSWEGGCLLWGECLLPGGVGLDLIPLNFPLGCGPGPDPPQFPPWVWAWIGACWDTSCNACWDTPPGDLLQGMIGYLLQCMLGYTPPCGQTHACKNITFATSLRTVTNWATTTFGLEFNT